jgi:hypothetical protein
MEHEIQPTKKKVGKQYPTLSVEDGNVTQKVLKDKGLKSVSWPSNTTNTMPATPPAGRRTALRQFGQNIDQMKSNISATIEHAKSQGKLSEWGDWYHHANAAASELSAKHGVTHDVASGVVAALSLGNTEWGVNKANADKVLGMAKHGEPVTTKHLVNTDGEQLNKALRIMGGEHPAHVLGDQKGSDFYHNVADPEKHSNRSTIDTQMQWALQGHKRNWAGAGGGAPDLNDPRKYKMLQDVVKGAGEEHGLSPMQTQAASWMSFKDMTPGTPGTPPPQHPKFADYYNVKDRRFPTSVRRAHFDAGQTER